jgi:hypothetical protein
MYSTKGMGSSRLWLLLGDFFFRYEGNTVVISKLNLILYLVKVLVFFGIRFFYSGTPFPLASSFQEILAFFLCLTYAVQIALQITYFRRIHKFLKRLCRVIPPGGKYRWLKFYLVLRSCCVLIQFVLPMFLNPRRHFLELFYWPTRIEFVVMSIASFEDIFSGSCYHLTR